MRPFLWPIAVAKNDGFNNKVRPFWAAAVAVVGNVAQQIERLSLTAKEKVIQYIIYIEIYSFLSVVFVADFSKSLATLMLNSPFS